MRLRWILSVWFVTGNAVAQGQPLQQGPAANPSDEPVRRNSAAPLVIAEDDSSPPPVADPDERDYKPCLHESCHPHRWHDGVAAGLSFGRAFVQGIEPGFYGRVDVGGYSIQRRRGGWIAGMLMGPEAWWSRSDDYTDWGATWQIMLYGGIQQDLPFAVLGIGFDQLFVDRVEQDTGFGLFAPQAMANVGLDTEGFRFLVDGRVSYRWQFGADDRTMFRLGGTLQFTTD